MAEPDMVLISELMEEMSRNPPAVAARKLLAEHYIAVGWLDTALDLVSELKTLTPGDSDIARLAETLERKPQLPAKESPVVPRKSSARYSKPQTRRPANQPSPQLNGDLTAARKDLTEGYTALRLKATNILANLKRLSALQNKSKVSLPSKDTSRIEAILEGRGTEAKQTVAPGSLRQLARTIMSNPTKATDLVIADLEDIMYWTRKPNGVPSGADDDTIRDALVKRVRALEPNLPDNLKIHGELGLMHLIHENIDKTYANDETMLGDAVKDIPREDFYVTEDNYAWDLNELVQAIQVNGGVMRNPLSRDMFTPKDVRGILMHPKGKSLAALQLQQHEMAKGVRLATIDEMEKLAAVLLDDQSSDQLPSRFATDHFLAYIATLPELEQKAIDGLRCPAKDSHTGTSYDFSIGEAVRDAKGNRVCFHKTGDFIQQAAKYLRNNQGVAPDSDDCLLM
ncbi:hypothetical protein DM02DRAFT_722812 [Periconia macrospinosa]|uniref:Uncharacterized protein n=1 Tax=Periconia macrospinosa TaxID=97972 RepID=A0A2V1EFT2_9PLEO|nr:hypothetical protein DM02DRAFT_722812 [Periconia macrospinosa]